LVTGSNPVRPTIFGLVAQGIEQQPSKLWVAGSNPAGVAIYVDFVYYKYYTITMKVRIVDKNILHLTFSSQKELTLTMCRPQEYYECNSLKLRNKVFTFENFIDHYLDLKGNISYFSYWAGFNIPGSVLEKFFTLFEMTKRESKLYQITRRFRKNPYYVIATRNNDYATLDHELLHAYYYLDPGYKQKVDTVVKHMRPELRKELTYLLRYMGYTKDVIVDEINAYMSVSSHKYLTEEFQLDLSRKDMKPFRDLAKTVLRD
jgi:hypothetical protein